jgi:hypothetical protein
MNLLSILIAYFIISINYHSNTTMAKGKGKKKAEQLLASATEVVSY